MIAFTREHFENVILPRMKKEHEDPKLYFDLTEPEKGNYEIVIGKDGIREAIVPVIGDLGNSRWWGTCYSDISENVQAADNDPGVDRIVLDVNSPGGYIDGVSETSETIKSAKKETVARVGNLAASAAFWLACACDKIEATTKIAVFGSIGVMVSYYDYSKYFEEAGIKHVVIISTDAPDKNLDPITKKGRENLIERLDKTHAIFAEAVAIGRKTTIEKVNSDFGRGGVLIAEDALKVGMIDKITIGQIPNNSEENDEMTEKTYSQAEFDAGIKSATDSLMKHTKFIGRAKNETVVANMAANKPFADCVEDYCAEESAAKELEKQIDANPPEGHKSDDPVEKTPEEKKAEETAKETIQLLKEWEVK